MFLFVARNAEHDRPVVSALSAAHPAPIYVMSMSKCWGGHELETLRTALVLQVPHFSFGLTVVMGGLNQSAVLGLLRDAL